MNDTITNMLHDEYRDVVAYMDLYKQTDNCIFRDIAQEEMVHAKHLEDILSETDGFTGFPDEKEKARKALES